MGRRIGYGKIGRSMPLSLERCGNLGGDVEMAAVVRELALRHPEDEFVLIGRNDLSRPADVNLPANVTNPWIEWAPVLRRELNAHGLNHANLSVAEQVTCGKIFDDLTLGEFTKLDSLVLWVGQHGTTNMPVPSIQRPGDRTKPHDWSAYYCAFIFRGVNAWRDADPYHREEVYLNADARNRHKMRDLKWPLRHPILTQYDFSHPLKHERFGDTRVPGEVADGFPPFETWYELGVKTERDPFLWTSTVRNIYSRLEVNGLAPGTPFGDLISFDDTWAGRDSFGLFINEARAIGVRPETARVNVTRDWVLPLEPAWVHGTWSAKSQSELGINISPAPWSDYYPRLHSVRSTFTTPSSGSGWATAKPWEAFAAGTVCFFHPLYDTQDNILGDAPSELRDWLRVSSPEELKLRVDAVNQSREVWESLVNLQRAHFDAAIVEKRYLTLIEERLYEQR